MLTETLSGKCPCCNYDKLLQRYGSQGYYQLDGCPNCGFGYGFAMGQEKESVVGEDAWIDYGIHIISMYESDKYVHLFEDDPTVKREEDGRCYSITDGGKTKDHKAVDYAQSILIKLPLEEKRAKIFEWAETQERCDDVDTTVFKYTEDDVKNYLATNPKIFKEITTN